MQKISLTDDADFERWTGSSEIHFDDHFDSADCEKTRSFSYQDVTKILRQKRHLGEL